ncbi:MAG: hypothetical protein ABI361_11885 [Nitrososphaera sp.]|jgi:hypothetical protein
MPFITSLESRHGLPSPSTRLFGSGINGLRIDHCSSVKSVAVDYYGGKKLVSTNSQDRKVKKR